MPSFDEIIQEVHRIAIEERVPEIAFAITNDKPVTPKHQALYETFVDRAYRTLVEREAKIKSIVR